MSVKWVYTLDGATYQIELRHGRKSGIRKLYLNKEMIERSKNIGDRFIDRGSKHAFRVGAKTAEILIIPGRSAGFKYELRIDDEPIERDLGITAAGLSAELGTHFVRPAAPVHGAGFGMTLANCGNRSDGVVVIEHLGVPTDPGCAGRHGTRAVARGDRHPGVTAGALDLPAVRRRPEREPSVLRRHPHRCRDGLTAALVRRQRHEFLRPEIGDRVNHHTNLRAGDAAETDVGGGAVLGLR